jgi:hypothetical protein
VNSVGGVRKQRDDETHQAVGAGFQQQAGQDHAARGGSLGVSIRQPGVQRDGRQLHREGDKEAEHDPELAPELSGVPSSSEYSNV